MLLPYIERLKITAESVGGDHRSPADGADSDNDKLLPQQNIGQ
jgi:hypothetical protein